MLDFRTGGRGKQVCEHRCVSDRTGAEVSGEGHVTETVDRQIWGGTILSINWYQRIVTLSACPVTFIS